MDIGIELEAQVLAFEGHGSDVLPNIIGKLRPDVSPVVGTESLSGYPPLGRLLYGGAHLDRHSARSPVRQSLCTYPDPLSEGREADFPNVFA